MTKIEKIVMFIGMVAIMQACTKEDEKTNGGGNNEDRTEKLTNSWMITSVKVDTLGLKDFDIWALFPDTCQKDDLYVFNADGTGAIDQNAIECDTTAPKQEPFTWTWENGETDLLVVLPDSNISLKNVQFSGNEMTANSNAVLDIQSKVTFLKQ